MNEDKTMFDDKEIREMYKANMQAAAPDMGKLWNRIEAAVDASEKDNEASERQKIKPSGRKKGMMRVAAAAAAFVLVAGAGAVWYKLHSSEDGARAPMNNGVQASSSVMTEASDRPEQSNDEMTKDPMQNNTNHLGTNKGEENENNAVDNIYDNDHITENIQSEVEYTYKYPDREPYHTVEEMMSQSDTAVVAKVTDISFMVHDDMSEPKPETPKEKVLCTVYGLDVTDVYKGDAEKSIRLKMSGGLQDSAYEEEQIAALGNKPFTEITVYPGQPTLEIGETYLLILREYENFAGYYYPVGFAQGVYRVDEEAADPSGFSVTEIMSFFGDDKRAEFESEYLHGAE